jgi:hypothetical protein
MRFLRHAGRSGGRHVPLSMAAVIAPALVSASFSDPCRSRKTGHDTELASTVSHQDRSRRSRFHHRQGPASTQEGFGAL